MMNLRGISAFYDIAGLRFFTAVLSREKRLSVLAQCLALPAW